LLVLTGFDDDGLPQRRSWISASLSPPTQHIKAVVYRLQPTRPSIAGSRQAADETARPTAFASEECRRRSGVLADAPQQNHRAASQLDHEIMIV